nr:presenilins-associated rhomboid-like protein, mitochondrial [Procambarus clarkii]XP_045614551.1 presenilins-associated rhomboid-like protein, mitochondrial [Procambarus clarkii]
MTVLSRIVNGMQYRRHLPLQPSLFTCFGKGYGSPTTVMTRGLRQPRRRIRQGGMNLAPNDLLDAPNVNNMSRGLAKSLLFAGGFCSTTFLAATIWKYESLRSQLQHNSWMNWANKQLNNLEGWDHKQGEFRKAINKWWNGLSEGQKVFWPICFINAVVFACWNKPSFQQTMLRYFCSNPAARAVCWPMFLSTFSHFAFLHFGMNMYVLHSFSSGVCGSLGREQFVAMYLSGGVISSLASHTFKVVMRCPGPSLGASGAIMALLGYFCTQYPNAQLGIVFIPGLNFSADTALKGVMCLDAVGMALGWRVFDHAAHLGGALFGLIYACYGPKYIWGNSQPLMKKWHELRNEINNRVEGSKTREE